MSGMTGFDIDKHRLNQEIARTLKELVDEIRKLNSNLEKLNSNK